MSLLAEHHRYTLGLDLGSASIGWVVVRLDDALEPCELLAANSHIFDPGVELPPTLKMAKDEAVLKGLDQSKAVARRVARQIRRQLDRKRSRKIRLFKLLREKGLLPTYAEFVDESQDAQRHHTFNRLDKELTDALCKSSRRTGPDAVMLEADQVLPYVLRRDAVDRELSPGEFGRVLYQLCQRRGYRPSAVDDSKEEVGASTEDQADEGNTPKKGRKARSKEKAEEAEEKESKKKVESGISRLDAKMKAAHSAGIIEQPLLGSYFGTFAANDPHNCERIRGPQHWTAREMFEQEFDAIWAKQCEFYRVSHPELLTDELRKEVGFLLFYQRPLASTDHLIGFCNLEKTERRAPWASLEAQRFRIWQKVNDLQWVSPDTRMFESLSQEQRQRLADELQTKGDLSFRAIRTLLGLPVNAEFNLQKPARSEEGKKKQSEVKIKGNRVNKVMLESFGPEKWNALPAEVQISIVEDWRTTEGVEARKRFAAEKWGLYPANARIWAENRPPGDYCNHSRLALSKLLERMEQGECYATTRTVIYGNPLAGKPPLDFVPQILGKDKSGKEGFLPSLNNPPVIRALTELRKVVNTIVRQYGKPYQIRIELARELSKNRKQRKDETERNEANQENRLRAAEKILSECHNYDAEGRDAESLVRERRDAVTKMLLHKECGGFCPYTGDPISFQQLFSGEVEVEHIIPQSMMVDNSFNNLTLCFSSENKHKLNRTPWQAYGWDEVEWPKILIRVQKFGNREKLRRFQTIRTEEDALLFGARRLNDTRYISKLAGRLLMTLYGGRDVVPDAAVDELDEFKERTGRRAIFVSSGMTTSLLRDAWYLNLSELIGTGAHKSPGSEDGDANAKPKKMGNKKKDRSDHRHHALDALVIALTSENLIRKINTLAGNFYGERGTPLSYRDLMLAARRHAKPDCLERDSMENIREIFSKMVVSRRQEHKLSGALHNDTFYGKSCGEKGKIQIRHKRIRIGKELTDKQVKSICDETVKKAVCDFRDAIGGFKKWSAERDGWPTLPNRQLGTTVPIKSVRIEIQKNTREIGGKKYKNFGRGKPGSPDRNGYPERNVEEGEFAYASFFIVQDRRKTKWAWEIVKMFEATERVRALPKRARGSVRICEKHSKLPEADFLFSLMKGDLIELLYQGQAAIYEVKWFEADARIGLAPANYAGKVSIPKSIDAVEGEEEQPKQQNQNAILRLGFKQFLEDEYQACSGVATSCL